MNDYPTMLKPVLNQRNTALWEELILIKVANNFEVVPKVMCPIFQVICFIFDKS